MVNKLIYKKIMVWTTSTLITAVALTGTTPVYATETDKQAAVIISQQQLSNLIAVRGVHNGDKVISIANANHYETEHFQILWGNSGNYNKVTKDFLERNAKDLEAFWDLYTGQLQMTPPLYSVNSQHTDVRPYKVNVVILGTGLPLYDDGWAFAGLDSQGYPYLMCSPDAMQDGMVIAHEFGHVTHFAQGMNSWHDNAYLSPWFEAVANWFREQYATGETYKQQSGTAGQSDFSALYLRATSLTAANGRAYYEAWPFLMYLEENPDQLQGYGTGFVAKMLKSGNPENRTESIYELIQRLNPQVLIQDTIGHFASHMATFDFQNKQLYRTKVKDMLQNGDLYWQQIYTMLNPIAGSSKTYTVPAERAPQAAGYNLIPMQVHFPSNAKSTVITASLQGLNKSSNSNWQAYIVVEDTNGHSRYSSMFSGGESKHMTVVKGEQAYISVAATPSLQDMQSSKMEIGSWDAAFSESVLPFEAKPRYPYQLTLDQAVPQTREVATDLAMMAGHRHKNGGGFVANEAHVDDSVYVAPDAMVLDQAVVTGNVRIEDHVIVRGSAQISDSAKLSGHALVQGNAQVSQQAILNGYAIVDNEASISGHAVVSDQAIVNGSAKILDNAQVSESALVSGFYTVSGQAVIKGLSIVQGGASDTEHGSATGSAITYGDFFDDMGYTITGGSFSGYESVEASVNIFKDHYVKGDGEGYSRP